MQPYLKWSFAYLSASIFLPLIIAARVAFIFLLFLARPALSAVREVSSIGLTVNDVAGEVESKRRRTCLLITRGLRSWKLSQRFNPVQMGPCSQEECLARRRGRGHEAASQRVRPQNLESAAGFENRGGALLTEKDRK